jgi:hypothetical protein
MSSKHDRVLQSIFHDPVSGNIHWRDIESLLSHLGANVTSGHGARMRVELNGIESTLHRPHQSGVCAKQDIRQLREFLDAAGIGESS